MTIDDLKNYRLVGGTALALQFGHRNSVDIDLFTYKQFSKKKLEEILRQKINHIHRLRAGEKSLSFYVNNTKVDFYNMEVPFIRPEVVEENIRMAHVGDIAAMKFDTITDRATKKDYYDIAEILNSYTFEELLGFYEEKYPYKITRNVIDIIRDIPLRNFELEKSSPPKTFRNISWNEVKKKILDSFDLFRNEEITKKIEEMKKRKKK